MIMANLCSEILVERYQWLF